MEDFKKKSATGEEKDKDIVFSRTVKAGKRIYYLDVKKNRKDEMYLAITESKKIVSGEGNDAQINFEKHKIFLYQEDFGKFISCLTEAIGFITNGQESTPTYDEETTQTESEQTTEETTPINIDIDF